MADQGTNNPSAWLDGSSSAGAGGTGTGVVSKMQILLACTQSIGTAATMAGSGFLLARSGLLSPQTAKGLAKISMNLTIPCLLFSTVVDCRSHVLPCPRVEDNIRDGWPLLLLPVFNVLAGMLVGCLNAAVFRPAEDFRRAVIAAVAFGNSTGMPLTLLAIMYNSLGGHNVLGEDPVMYLSVYLLVYPLLTWAVGGTLMGINHDPSLSQPTPPEGGPEGGDSGVYLPLMQHDPSVQHAPPPPPLWRRCLTAFRLGVSRMRPALLSILQPPVVASLVGIAVAVSPLRAALVDLQPAVGDGNAPLEFFADGVQRMGQAAVPINMLILGATLSKGADWKTLPLPLNLSIAFSKMVVMPAIGLCTARALKRYFPDMGGSFFLVVVMETCTPTANNLLVMAELGNQNKQALATAIFTQYLLTPLLLTGSTWLAVTQALDSI